MKYTVIAEFEGARSGVGFRAYVSKGPVWARNLGALGGTRESALDRLRDLLHKTYPRHTFRVEG